jgi:hypothetical protein
MPSGVYERTPEQLAAAGDRLRAMVERRRTAGEHLGRPRTYTIRNVTCRECGVKFPSKKYPGKRGRVVCSRECARARTLTSHSGLPCDFESVYDLYWNQNLTTIEIAERYGIRHRSVLDRMVKLGVPRRRSGPRILTMCIIAKCDEPPYKLIHSINGSAYGRRCLCHWIAHRKKLAAEYWLKIVRWKRRGVASELDVANAIDTAIPSHVIDENDREEIRQELALRLLLGETTVQSLSDTALQITKKLHPDRWRTISLDTPIGEGDGLTIADTIADTRMHF